MPTYRVTDPNTGRTVKLEGDAPPTEQELDDIFKQLGSAPAADAGVAAPAAAAPVPVASPLLAYNGITGSIVPKDTQLRAASAIAGSEQAPLNPEVSRLPLLGPILDLARTLREAGPDVARNLVGDPLHPFQNALPTIRGMAAGSAEGLMDLASPLNIALQALPYVRNMIGRGGPAAPNPLAGRTGTAAVPMEPVPAAGGFSPPSGTGVMPGPAPRPILPEAVTTGTGAAPGAVTAGGFSPARTGTGGFSMTARAAAPAVAAEAPAVASVVDDVVKATTDAVKAGADPVTLVRETEQKVRLSVPDLVRRMRDEYGSARAGDMLFGNRSTAGPGVLSRAERGAAIKRMAPGESKLPNVARNYAHGVQAQVSQEGIDIGSQLRASLAERMKTETGAVNPMLLSQIGGAVAGGAAGVASADDPEDRIVRGIIGAGLGAAAPLVIAKAATNGLEKTAQDIIYTSTLSSPTSVAKAYLGAIGGAVSAAGELSVTNPQASQRILTTLFSRESAGEFARAFRHGGGNSGIAAQAPTVVGRFFNAGDAVAKRAMAAGGIGAEDAARYTLAGLPTTRLGRGILELWNQHLVLRLGTTLFPRVGIQVLERGIERSPLGLIGSGGINAGTSMATRAVRAGVGTAAGLAAYEFSDQIPDAWKPFLLAATGPYSLPAGVGMAAGKAVGMGKGTSDTVKAAAGEVARNMPFPQYGPIENIMQHATLSSAIPAGMRDIAVGMDPYERDTSGGFFDRAKAKIPGVREQLPVKGRRVNIAGDPIRDRTTPLSRVMNPAPSQNEPFRGVPETVKQEVQRLGVNLNPPKFEKTAKLGNKEVPIPPDTSERIQKQRREFLVPAIEKLLASASYQAAPDDVKKRRLEATINQAEERGSAKARALLSQVLRSAPNAKQR